MPRVTKDTNIDNLVKENINISTRSKTTSKSQKKQSANSSKTNKTTNSTKQKTSRSANSSTSRKKSAVNTTTQKTAVSKIKNIENNIVAEYYDLPYRYNETMVKILYQTPNILFVYWDISDTDRENFKTRYGENFFNNTKPILKVFNLTKNYNFEVEINDFANSWYINVNDANCDYKIELARKTIKFEENLNTDYIYVSDSNNIEFPNDRILLDNLPTTINFKNIKTNEITQRNISTAHLVGIKKVYTVHKFYKEFYKNESLNNISNHNLSSWS